MLLKLILFACIVLLCCYECTGAAQNGTSFTRHDREASRLGILARKRRYVAFPEGSSFSVAVCATIGVIGNPNVNYLSYGLNWGVAYDLPNQTWILDHVNGFKNALPPEKSIQKRRERRDVYQKLEMAIENMGYSGRACILRALCESSKFFYKRKNTMIEEMLKTIFSFPKSIIFSHEHPDVKKYANAFKSGPNIKDCSAVYKNCGFSLLDLVFGKYSKPLNEYL